MKRLPHLDDVEDFAEILPWHGQEGAVVPQLPLVRVNLRKPRSIRLLSRVLSVALRWKQTWLPEAAAAALLSRLPSPAKSAPPQPPRPPPRPRLRLFGVSQPGDPKLLPLLL